MTTVALLLAAGSGLRLGGRAKAFLELGGVPMFVHSLRTIAATRSVDGVVMLVPEGYLDTAARWEDALDLDITLTTRTGGSTRQDSVRKGLSVLPEGTAVVLCQDAARPFASGRLFERVLSGLGADSGDGVVPVVPSPDTVKRIEDGRVVETIRRGGLRLVQTPQAFSAPVLMEAHEQASRSGLEATDDAMLLEAAGYRVAAVDGEATNFKITTPEDLERAEWVVARSAVGRGEEAGAGRG